MPDCISSETEFGKTQKSRLPAQEIQKNLPQSRQSGSENLMHDYGSLKFETIPKVRN
jgi:hypothetical protein